MDGSERAGIRGVHGNALLLAEQTVAQPHPGQATDDRRKHTWEPL